MNKRYALFIAIVLAAAILLACSGGYTEVGGTQTSSIVNGTGTITKTIQKANGSSTTEIDLENTVLPGAQVSIDVTLEVGEGSYRAEFLDEDDNVVLTLEAKSGESASGSAVTTLNSFAKLRYKVTAAEARQVKMVIELEAE